MGIRVNPDMYSVILNGLQVNSQQEDQALQQVSSGQKLNSLSDDPAAAASLVNLRMQSSSNAQYLQNISSLTGSLNVADSALSSVVEALTAAQTVGVEGTNSTLNGSNRQALAQQIQGIQQQIGWIGPATGKGPGHTGIGAGRIVQPADDRVCEKT